MNVLIARLFNPARYIGRHRAPSVLTALALRLSRNDSARVATSS